MVAQLATFHAPDDLVIAACVEARRHDWEWLKWLPHALHPTLVDAVGPRRLVAAGADELGDLLADLLGSRRRFSPPPSGRSSEPHPAPHVVVLVEGGLSTPTGALTDTRLGAPGGLAGVTLIEVADTEPSAPLDRSAITLTVGPDLSLTNSTVDDVAVIGRADQLGPADAEGLARRLARLRLSHGVREQPALAADRDLVDLLGIDDISTVPLAQLWAPRPGRDALRIPIGTGPDGDRVDLDIKEAAQDGMGPHGLVVGATGSGKSELLRTLVLGLAATHPSDVLNVVLVDFKGGATFASLDRLPHTSAVITNLADELPLVDRMNDALAGELTRRQELLRQAGNLASLREYERAPRARTCPRCPSCCWCATSSPSCSRPSRTSSTCSSRSAGSAVRSGCICSWPPSGLRRGGSAGSSPISPTRSPCGRSRPASPASPWASPTRRSCRRRPGTAICA
jgi:S-DNA-T family DNA segregation ATPase FtsK/SpoIIIE